MRRCLRGPGPLLILALCLLQPATPVGADEWMRTLARGIPHAADMTAGGDLVFAVRSTSSWFVGRADREARVQWLREFPVGATRQRVEDIRWTPDGGVVVAGFSDFFDTGSLDEQDPLVLRLDGAGTLLWARLYDMPSSNSRFESIAPLADGSGYWAVGWYEAEFSKNIWWVLRLDAAGDVLLQRGHRGSGDDEARWVEALSDGGAVVGGSSLSVGGTGRTDALVQRFDDQGTVVWQKGHTHPEDVTIDRLRPHPQGGWALAGGIRPDGTDPDGMVGRLAEDGELLWAKPVGGDGSDAAYGLAVLDNGDLVVGMESRSFETGWDGLLAAVDTDGALLWGRWRQTQGSFQHYTGFVFPHPDQGLLELGYEDGLGPSGRHVTAVRTEAASGLVESCEFLADQALAQQGVSLQTVDVSLGLETTSAVPTEVQIEPVELVPVETELCAIIGGDPPDEVSPPGAAQPFLADSKTSWIWEEGSLSRSDEFLMYRGDLSELSFGTYGACHKVRIPTNSVEDAELPGPGQGWFYLVAGRNASGDGPNGSASDGSSRAATRDVCP